MIGWFTNQRLQVRFLLLFSTFTLLGAGLMIWYVLQVLYFQSQVQATILEAKDMAYIDEVQVFLLEQQLAMTRFAESGSLDAINSYADYEEQANQYLEKAMLFAVTTDERDTLGLIVQESERFSEAYQGVVELAEAGELAAAQTEASRLLEPQQDRLEQVHEQIEGLVYRASLRLDELGSSTDQEMKAAIAVAVAGLLAFSGLIILSALVTNQVAEPVMHLTNAVIAFESGTYRSELLESYFKRREEIGHLAIAFDRMVHNLQKLYAAQEKYLHAARRFIPTAYLDFLEKPSITDVKLGDHVSAEMAVMFSDVRSFTTLSEGMTPAENFAFVNDYLKQVSPIIQSHNGFVVKFLGDGMMAVFPYDVEDAVRAGLAKIQVVQRFNAARREKGLPPIDVGIGIHTGHMMVGMIGEEGRMQGDAFSDNVNLTSRLEGLNKYFGTNLIISGETLARLEDPGQYILRPLGRVRVKGRSTPIGLYEVLGEAAEALPAEKQATLADFKEGVRLFTRGLLTEAREKFKAVLALAPNDKAAFLYVEQVDFYAAAGKGDGWDGVIEMAAK